MKVQQASIHCQVNIYISKSYRAAHIALCQKIYLRMRAVHPKSGCMFYFWKIELQALDVYYVVH